MTIPTISPVSKATAILIAATLLLLVFVAIQAQTKPPYPKATLIAGLKQSAKDKKLSSQDFVRLIQERGVSFQMNERDEAELRTAGATNEVITAIRQNYRWPAEAAPTRMTKGNGALTINSRPGVSVFLNGKLKGTTNDSGIWTISPLKAGQYQVALKKDNFEAQERSVTVAPGLEVSEVFDLSPVKGQLTVIPNVSGGQVKLNGVDYPNGITSLDVPAQTYELRITKPGFKIFTKTITVSPRGSVTVEAPLEPIPVEEGLAQIASFVQANRYTDAISAGRGLLATHPDNARANLLVGLSYYLSSQYSQSVPFLTKAIALGEQVVIPVKHHHSAVFNDDLCSGTLTIGQGVLGFSSADRAGHDFMVPASKIYELKPEPRKSGRVHVQVGIPKGSKEDKKSYNFQTTHTGTRHLDPNDASSIIVLYCNDCEEEALAMYQLLKQLKDAPPGVSQPNIGIRGEPELKPRSTEPENTVGRPTLTRRPTESDEPDLAFAGRESFQVSGRNFTRYKLAVTNRTSYSSDMFVAAPDLPPCGRNTNSSRTWVDIFDNTGKRIYGFCALTSSDDLASLWFAVPEGQAPPSEVFILLMDRRAKKEYRSKPVAIP